MDDALRAMNDMCVETGVCERDLDCLAVTITIHAIEHEAAGGAKLVNPVKAADPNIPCKCFGYKDGNEEQTYCWKPGYLGLISTKKNPEQMANCRIRLPAGEGVAERFKEVRAAVSEAHERWKKKGGGIPEWWGEVATSLEEHKVSL